MAIGTGGLGTAVDWGGGWGDGHGEVASLATANSEPLLAIDAGRRGAGVISLSW